MPMNDLNSIFIIEDDVELATAIKRLLSSDINEIEVFHSAEDFFDYIQKNFAGENSELMHPGCVILDVRLPGMSGLNLFDKLNKHKTLSLFPTIFLTGHGEIDMGVDAMKNGAFDFFPKPFNSEKLITTVSNALLASKVNLKKKNTVKKIEDKINLLTAKEKELMHEITKGYSNKEIATRFNNSIRTIELHRSRVFEKMEVASAVELTIKLERLNSLKD